MTPEPSNFRNTRMPKYIEPKPTTYRSILYRSKLEARWAVFLDSLPNVLHHTYEPANPKTNKPFHHKEKGWSYTPDFHIKFFLEDMSPFPKQCRGGSIYIEVKPKMVTPEYLYVLCEFSKQIPILLVCGSWFDCVFSSALLINTNSTNFSLSTLCPTPQLLQKAASKAQGYRFDLR